MNPNTLVSTMGMPAIQDLIKKSFTKSVYSDGGDVRKIFHKDEGDWSSNTKRIKEVDRDRFAEQKTEGGLSAERGIAEGYHKDVVRKTVSIKRIVTGEAFKALQAHKLATYATQTGEDVVDKIELDMRNYLGFATGATSYTDNGGFTIDLTVGDGLSVFDTTHTLKYSTTTYSNILSGAPSFSENSLTSAEDFFNYNVMDNFGQRIEMKANTIITSKKAVMVNRVSRLLGSDAPATIEGTANANAGVKNTYRKRYQHLVVEFDVDARNVTNSSLSFYWFLASLGGDEESSFQAYYVSWMSPMVAPAEVDQDRWILKYIARACYGIAAVSGKGILVSKATS